MPSTTNPGQKLYLGYGYSIYRSGASYAVYAWPKGRLDLEDRATAHYFSRRTDAARWLQASIRRLAEKKQGD